MPRKSSRQIYGRPVRKMGDQELIDWFQETYFSMDITAYPDTEHWEIATMAEQELRRRGYKIRPVLPETPKKVQS